MKKIMMGMLCGVALSSSSFAQDFLNKVKLDVKTVNAPEFELDVPDFDKDTNNVNRRWLRVKYLFNTDEAKDPAGDIKWVDDVTVKTEVLIPSKSKGKKSVALLVGDTTYAGIKRDGGKHQGRMFIAPYFFDRYMRPADSSIADSDVKDFKVAVSFSTSTAELGQVYLHDGRVVTSEDKNFNSVKRYWMQCRSASSDMVQVYEGTVFSADKTPWAYINSDSYEYIKVLKDK